MFRKQRGHGYCALSVVKLVVRVYILSNFYYSCFSVKTKTRTKEKENASAKKTAEEANGSGVLFPTHYIVICREPAGNSRTLWINGWIQRSCFK